MNRRREALGRNRRGPAVRPTMGKLVFGMALLAALGLVAFRYFTQPQRVYGAKTFDCSGFGITWTRGATSTPTNGPSLYYVSGCGYSHLVRCTEDECRPLSESFERANSEAESY